jgi:hypothetical protein
MPSDRKYRIKATRNKKDDYSFALENFTGGGPPNLVFNKDDINGMHKRDYFVLEFHLDNNSGCDLEFLQDREKVLSACPEHEAVDGCALEGSNYLPIFFVHPTMKLDKKKIHVINTDPYNEKFFFGFSFVSKDGTEKAYFDPGGENQNGGIGQFEWSNSLTGAITGAVAAIATVTLVSNSFEPASALIFGIGGAVVGLIFGLIVGRF